MSFWAVWASFWGELNTPDCYHDDPYGGGLNQLGHVALGSTAAVMACLIWAGIFDEMPYRRPLGMAVAGGYTVVIEWWRQGWQGADSIVDSAFFSMGVSLPLVSLHEVAFLPRIILEPQIGAGLSAIGATATALLVYVWPRAVRKYRGA